MGDLRQMTDAETAAHLRRQAAGPQPKIWSWPTDACGYDQHMRFVQHRNDNWKGSTKADWREFVLAYAGSLEDVSDV